MSAKGKRKLETVSNIPAVGSSKIYKVQGVTSIPKCIIRSTRFEKGQEVNFRHSTDQDIIYMVPRELDDEKRLPIGRCKIGVERNLTIPDIPFEYIDVSKGDMIKWVGEKEVCSITKE